MQALRGGWQILLFSLLLLIAIPSLATAVTQQGSLPELLPYEVTEHAPIIKGRHDQAFQRALEASFRKAVLAALQDVGGAAHSAQDFAGWQAGIFSRAGDFIASYRILSQVEKEGYLSLSVRAEIYRNKLEEAVEAAAGLSPALPVRILVLVDTFPLSGTSGFEDIDAGHLASTALETEFLRKGFIILPSPERLPWQHLAGRATTENIFSLAAAEGKRLGADYVLLGRLRRRADKLLLLTVELLSPTSLKTITTARSPVELQPGAHPGESFADPALEVAKALSPKLAQRPGRLQPGKRSP